MNTAQGQVHSYVQDESGTRVVVDVAAAQACPRCASGKGCGAALIVSPGRRIEVPVPKDMALAPGDQVEISLAPDGVLGAALIVYGLPLFAAVSAAILAYALSLGDMAASLAALSGLFVGLAIARRRLAGQSCLQQFVPTISRRVPGGASS